ncbi:hypothetical protein [Anaerococcus sp. Marseille-P3625]|uniref:hypothetical protein n=1 Tax=Anaerococcus sp. Marseille-P3625 TaxID=1977277 RepID=UPI000C06AEFC|nr:hypothetical protein [Anaerococcus sp. Marseille-P3625]
MSWEDLRAANPLAFEARKEFNKYYETEKMLDMVELSIDIVKDELVDMGMYKYFKEVFSKDDEFKRFVFLDEKIGNLVSEIELEDKGEEVGNIILKSFYSYWLAELVMRKNMMARYSFTYASICKDELSKYMDFYQLLDYIKNVDNDKETLLNFLTNNWNEDIKNDIDAIRSIVDYQDLRSINLDYVNSNLESLNFPSGIDFDNQLLGF